MKRWGGVTDRWVNYDVREVVRGAFLLHIVLRTDMPGNTYVPIRLCVFFLHIEPLLSTYRHPACIINTELVPR